MKKYILLLIFLGFFCSCSHQPSFKEKVCARYIGKELKILPRKYPIINSPRLLNKWQSIQ